MSKSKLQEKRLQTLRQQLYGKDRSSTVEVTTSKISTNQNLIIEKTDYIKRDLLKVLILSLSAIGIQFLIYFALQQHLIKF